MSKINNVSYYKSPIGLIEITADISGISSLYFIDEPVNFENTNSYINECIKQLNEYFKGTRKEFNLKLNIDGTLFRKKVWNKLMNIPYGETCSYLDIAKAIENEKSVRAVGGANHNNKISIIIPCHRVIGSDGSLTGYGGGLWRKEWLLNHERQYK
ncbi:methylated-DNA--[protein]-cysteine S-methyltransferase [Clostridium sp. DJ247]|uniref:methylated-DNA--[protein]-cysteine S-methyltransferase n=1 Tax=Clostridium sp. DJ247 TaxID=2726188 RepID=UPI001627D2EC|nr:methylated-DNA--[protein]-cysteine S-methyltransferase [Clostridium sp. DJ247]MBC2580924.1 methylated-DNA--[protein]-cysteine S-methyltransferase [Clostridium sp. DJ247]